MVMQKLHCFPIIVGTVFPLSFITTYIIALSLDHILPFFSYISDTGTFAPESCIFSLLLNISALFLGFVVYIRFKQVEEVFRDSEEEIWGVRMNKVGIILGFISAFGISVVGCFQETNVISMHIVGAFMCFLGGGLYLCAQSFLSFKLLPLFGSQILAWIRSFVGVVCVLLFIICYSTGTISLTYFHGKNAAKWYPEDGGWALHVTSIVSEWTMAAFFDLYILTFIPEFRKITFEAPKFNVVEVARKSGNSNTKKATSEKIVMQRVTQEDIESGGL